LYEKNTKIPEIYMTFARKIPEFYIIIAQEMFLPVFWGHVPSLSRAPVSYDYDPYFATKGSKIENRTMRKQKKATDIVVFEY